MRKRIAGEFPEESLGIKELTETLIESFIKTDSNYGMITDVRTDLNLFYRCIKDYVKSKNLDVYALRFGDRILLSRTSFGFNEIYKVVKMKSTLRLKKDMLEIWDDEENKILHLVIAPLKKHFPLEYSNKKERLKIIENLQL